MKTIFEGIVNGQKFDNVADYNEALTKAINEGNVVQASSRTYSTEEPEPAAEPNEESPALPNFYIGMDPDNYYMDMMTGDEEVDDNTLEKVNETLTETIHSIADVLNELTDDDLKVYQRNLSNIAVKLDGDRTKNNALIGQFDQETEELSEKLREIEKKLDLLSSCEVLNDMMKQYYSELIELVGNEIQSRTEKTAPAPAVNEMQAQQEMLIDGVKRLLDEIFNK